MNLKECGRQAALGAERVAIKEALERAHWNRTKAAQALQISYKALLYKIVQCGLVNRDGASPAPRIAECVHGVGLCTGSCESPERSAEGPPLVPGTAPSLIDAETPDATERVQPERTLLAGNILRALRATNGHRVRAAWLLGLAPKTLYNRLAAWPELRDAPPAPRAQGARAPGP